MKRFAIPLPAAITALVWWRRWESNLLQFTLFRMIQ